MTRELQEHFCSKNTIQVAPGFSNFDALSDSDFVSIQVVCKLFSCSRATIWRRVRSGELVAPYRIGGRTTRWQVGQLRCVLAIITGGRRNV